MIISSYDHTFIWSYAYMIICLYELPLLWSQAYMFIRLYVHVHISEHTLLWSFAHMVILIWSYAYMIISLYDHMHFVHKLICSYVYRSYVHTIICFTSIRLHDHLHIWSHTDMPSWNRILSLSVPIPLVTDQWSSTHGPRPLSKNCVLNQVLRNSPRLKHRLG